MNSVNFILPLVPLSLGASEFLRAYVTTVWLGGVGSLLHCPLASTGHPLMRFPCGLEWASTQIILPPPHGKWKALQIHQLISRGSFLRSPEYMENSTHLLKDFSRMGRLAWCRHLLWSWGHWYLGAFLGPIWPLRHRSSPMISRLLWNF